MTRAKYPPPLDIPVGSVVRDRKTGWVGILKRYGRRAAGVQFYADKPMGEWVKLYNIEAVTKEELEQILAKEREMKAQRGEDLV